MKVTLFTQIWARVRIHSRDCKTSMRHSLLTRVTICGFQASPMLGYTDPTSHGRSTSGTCSKRCIITQTRWSHWRALWSVTGLLTSIRTLTYGIRTLYSTLIWYRPRSSRKLRRKDVYGSGTNFMTISIHTQMPLNVTIILRLSTSKCLVSINTICTAQITSQHAHRSHLYLKRLLMERLWSMVRHWSIREDPLLGSVHHG
jgi:hypothetical protein